MMVPELGLEASDGLRGTIAYRNTISGYTSIGE